MEKINTDLYSRQIFTYGLDTMEKITNLKIIIVGLRGLGIEIAKNLILTGPKEVLIYDKNICKINDLGSNFYINEDDINKKTREESCYKKLCSLNPYVKVTKYEGNIKNNINKYNLIIITEIMKLDELFEINNICRKYNIGFIYALNLGLTGFLFNDFGDNHIINNINGEQNLKYNIYHIEKSDNIYEIFLDLRDNNVFNLKEGDYVIFKQVKGLEELNDGVPRKIISHTNNSFTIENNKKNILNKKYENSGIIEEKKIPTTKKFYSFKTNIDTPNKNIIFDPTKKNVNQLLHLAFVGLHQYYTFNNKLPDLNDLKNVNEVIELSHKFYEKSVNSNFQWIKVMKKRKITDKIIDFDKSYITNVLRWSKSELNPICSFLGGIVSQEAIKITGKYDPIYQWLNFDFFETIENLPKACNRKLMNCRYDDQIAIFGREFQEKLSNKDVFMIGAGALGCEYLKNFALMGISCNSNSSVTVTDNDNIVTSNLNRQFLFRQSDVGMSKSTCACREAKIINKNISLKPYQHLLCDDTKTVFNDIFWDNQDIIISAVDKLSARKYIDKQCTFYNKYLIDSGTQGTNGSYDIYIPKETICFNDLSFSNKKEIPSCTLKNFPTEIEHCIEWSKSNFIELFNQIIKDIQLIYENKKQFYEILNDKISPLEFYIKLQKMTYLINIIDNPNNISIIKYGIFLFKYYFDFTIEQTLKEFPLEGKNGIKYWDNYRKAPKPIKIDSNNISTKNFFKSFYYILTNLINYKENNYIIDDNYIINNIEKEESGININLKDLNNEQLLKLFENNIIKKVENNENNIQKKLNNIKPMIFEKDNDENHHINFIMLMSNLRAKNYQIKECDFLRTKEIAGNIIPAIASTTASITGLACIQIYNILYTNDINYYRSGAFNLATSEYSIFVPEEKRIIEDIQKTKDSPEYKAICEFSKWDKINLFGPNMLIKNFIDIFKKRYNVEIDNINYEEINLTSPILDGDEDYNKTIEELYIEKTGKKIDKKLKYIELKINGSLGDADILTPRIKYFL
jgi:ubiquitin-activating enzyme E1